MRKINNREVNVVTSLDVAGTFGKLHKDVLESIRSIQETISTAEFSALFFKTSYTAPNGKQNPMYLMDRDGFTLLVMGYTGGKAMQFKLAYIKQFNAMEELLKGKQTEREIGIVARQAFTKAIKENGENERMHGHAYSLYTNIIYKTVFGKNAKQLREEYGITRQEDLRDCFSMEELERVKSIEMIASGLVNCGWGYDEVKDFITGKAKRLIPDRAYNRESGDKNNEEN